jgi:hypothetical protein
MKHVYISSQGFSDMLMSRYVHQSRKQWYVVLLSLELIGSPIQLIQLLKEGLWDFVYFPTAGLFTSPHDFFNGIARGTHSLIRNVIASTATTCGNFINSLQVGLIASGAVDSYPDIDRSQELVVRKRSHRPASLPEALVMALTGIYIDTTTGYRADGPSGLVMGLTKGLTGLFARPLYGLLGTGSYYMDSISSYFLPRFLANQKLRLIRVRPPRHFLYPNQPLQVYSAEENLGLQLLSQLGPSYSQETLLWFGKLEQRSLLLTKARVMFVEERFDQTSVIWQCLLGRVLSIEVDYATSSAEEMALQMIDGNQIRLTGQPYLKLYYLPADTRESRKSSGLNDIMRCDQQTWKFTSHDQLLQFLHKLLRISPSLASADILAYLEAVGVDVSAVRGKGSPYPRTPGLFAASPKGLTGIKQMESIAKEGPAKEGSGSQGGGDDYSIIAAGHSRSSSFAVSSDGVEL